MHNEELREKAFEAGDATPLQKQSSATNCFNCGELQTELDQQQIKAAELATKVENLEKQLKEAS